MKEIKQKKVKRIENTNTVLIPEENDDIDVLDRNDLIEQIIKIIEYYSNKKQSISFSIQGSWGSGKTWLVRNLSSKLYNYQDINIAGGKYCILNFNPWQFDYYNEPLLSLILNLKEQVTSEKFIFKVNKDHIDMLKNSLEILSDELINPVLDCISVATMNPFISVFGKLFIKKTKQIKNKLDNKDKEQKKNARYLNPYIDLEEIMKKTIEGLNKISSDKTIILFVDELDRCSPEFAIKVLERMHHISQSVNNIQIIYSIDKKQIEETVRNIYGQKVNAKDYLKKFFSFGFNLSTGFVNENFTKKYEHIFKDFDFIFTDNFDKEKAFSSILIETDMRERENIIQKIELINSFLNKEQKNLDISILYVELFLANCFANGINIYNSEVRYENNKLLLVVENDGPGLKKYREISEFFESLSWSHNVKHELHGYDGFYDAKIENVVYNLLNNLINNQLPRYAIAYETDFYSFGLEFLMNFKKMYKSIEM